MSKVKSEISKVKSQKQMYKEYIQYCCTILKIPIIRDKEIAEYYGVHYTAVSRAIQKVE